MPPSQPNLFGLEPLPRYPDGFRYQENTITDEEEASFIKEIAPLPFKEFQFRGYEGKRRVVSFGWSYSFNDHKLHKADPIPAFLMELYSKVQTRTGFLLRDLQQALVTEYSPGAGIGWHRDRPIFGEVMGLSLVSPCVLRLRRAVAGKWERVSIPAAPRSAYYFDGPARWEWEHSIPPVECLRYSVTFRNLRH